MRSATLATLGCALSACGVCVPITDGVDAGVGDVTPDAHIASDASAFDSAPPTRLPVVPDQGGVRLAHPQLVVITLADDTNRATLEAHARWMVSSTWLTTVGAEYGIGAGSILANVELTDVAPDTITSSAVSALIASGLADHSIPAGPGGSFDGVLYVIYFPSHTVITAPRLGVSCHGYEGYHSEGTSGGHAFSYAVVPSCPGASRTLTDLESEEKAAAHEVIEAATDPRPTTAPAFQISRTAVPESPWNYVGPELADLCSLRQSNREAVREAGFVAPRVWSNAAAIAGDRDPCVPTLGRPYQAITISPTHVVSCAAGASTTFDITAWATAPVAPFGLYAAQTAGTFSAGIAFDRTIVSNGDHAMVTVTVPTSASSGGYGLIYIDAVRSAVDFEAFPVVVTVP